MKLDYFLIFVGLTCLLLGFGGKHNWLLDLFAHPRIYYFFYFFLVFLFSLVRKKWKPALFSGLIFLGIISSLSRFYLPIHNSKTESSLKVASINLWSGNRKHMEVRKYIHDMDFDIILLQEYTPRWDNYLSNLKQKYPYQEKEVRDDNFGIALMSKRKIEEVEFEKLSKYGLPTIIGKFKIGEKDLSIIGTHPVPPTARIPFHDRNEQFKKLNKIVRDLEKENEVVLMGDFNCTSFSPNFSLLTEASTLRDSRLGFGLLTTWWAEVEFIHITLDHALVSDGIEVVNRSVGPFIGSDHLPVELEIGLKVE